MFGGRGNIEQVDDDLNRGETWRFNDEAERLDRKIELQVDFSEAAAALPELARESRVFDVRMVRLPVGDYVINGCVLVERKTYADFANSLSDGRLFPQAARLARSRLRSVILIEGPRPRHMPKVNPHALKGAAASLAVMWRLPILYSRDPEDSLLTLQFLGEQSGRSAQPIARRYTQKPKRSASRKLHILQGLPGTGPALAYRLLLEFGSIEGVLLADENALTHSRSRTEDGRADKGNSSLASA